MYEEEIHMDPSAAGFIGGFLGGLVGSGLAQMLGLDVPSRIRWVYIPLGAGVVGVILGVVLRK